MPADLVFILTIGFVLLHCLAAAAVSGHALLRKRDVRAAAGWIGLAWLSPGLGIALYFVFGINRVTRRASRLRGRALSRKLMAAAKAGIAEAVALDPSIAAIARVSARTTGFMLVPGNDLAILRCGDEAYPAMLAAISGAKRSIALTSYIFEADGIGRAFIDALAEARARGVEIRVLLDGIGSGYWFSGAARRLAAAGIPHARFLHYWLPWRMPFLNMRNHKKLLIVDGSLGFTGGLNIAAQNVLADHPRHPVDDRHFRIVGPVVRQMMVTFAEDWNFTTGEVLQGERWWPDIRSAGGVLARGVSSGPDEDIDALVSILATAIGQAERRVRILTPYFLPDLTLNSAIALAGLRGVAIDIVIPERTDNRMVDWAMRAHLALLAGPGIRISASPPPFDHSKLMSVDGVWSLLGSANWDVRSLRLNFEFNIECYNSEVTARIDRVIDRAIAAARPLGPETLGPETLGPETLGPETLGPKSLGRRSRGVRLRDAAARLLLPYL